VFKGGANFSFRYTASSSDDSATVIVNAVSEFGRKALVRPRLTIEAQNLVGDSALFARTCGSRFVNIERRGASVSAILTIRGMTKEEKTSISSGVSGEGGWGPLSASASAKFEAELAKAVKTGRADIQVVATGGNGFGGLGDTVKALASLPESLPAIQSALSVYITQFNSGNAVPIGFWVESMEAVGFKPSVDDIWTLQLERKLRALVTAYRETSAALVSASSIAHKTDVRSALMSEGEIAAMTAATTDWESKLDEIAEAYQKCKIPDLSNHHYQCNLVAAPSNLSLVPPVPVGPSALFRVLADEELLGEEQSRAIVYDNSAPLIDRVSVFRPGSHTAKIVFSVSGHYLVSCNLLFRGNPSQKSILGLSITGDRGNFPIATEAGLAGIMSNIFKFTTTTVPDGNGTFFLRIRDSLGRVFDLDVYEADWNSNSPFGNMKGQYISY
jgi:hypothetical protein